MSERRRSDLSVRTRGALAMGAVAAGLSRRVGAGNGTVIGGKLSLTLDPGSVKALARGLRVALVSGTNGKTTTTRFLASALKLAGPVVTNSGGSNLPSGLVTALSIGRPGQHAALEVDEGYLGTVAADVVPVVILLLNLSRDQLDRINEVRMLGARWRSALERLPATWVVANADDPIVAWAAGGERARVTWVAAGAPWLADASGCPSCEARIGFSDGGWSCATCGLSRPQPAAWIEGGYMVQAGGRRIAFELGIPGSFNRANAAMAAVAAAIMGVSEDAALQAMAATTEIEGRYQVVDIGGIETRLLLAKNPAGWLGVFEVLREAPTPVVVAINARVADGRDPSWLWDVPFERLADRSVVATGERSSDLSVRLRYAGVDHSRVPDPLAAVKATGAPSVDFAGNYTAFQDLRRRLGG